MRNNNIFKIIILIIIFTFFNSLYTFSADILLNFNYGINNTAKSGRLLPLNISIINREVNTFNGKMQITIFENDRSEFNYEYDLSINGRDVYDKIVDISIADKSNSILIRVFDENNTVVASDRLNIDLSSLESRLLIGVISDKPNLLNYFDTIALKNGNIHTKAIKLNISDFLINRQLLNQFDCLLISGIDISTDNSENAAFNKAVEKFISDGKIIIIGSGSYGTLSIPQIFQKYLSGPSETLITDIDLNGRFTNNENIYPLIELFTTNYDFLNNKNIYTKNNNKYLNTLQVGNGIVVNAMFDFCDFNSYFTTNNVFVMNFLDEVFGSKRLEQIETVEVEHSIDGYNSLKSLVDIVDSLNLPDIMLISFFVIIYVLFVLIILYAILRNKKNLRFYNELVIASSIIFLIILILYTLQYKRQKTFMTYCDITELSSGSTNERAILNFITSDNSNFSFNTSANNTIYPVLKNNNKSIDFSNERVLSSIKQTNFKTIDNVQFVDVNYSSEFESNIFIYENRNDLNSYYNIDARLTYFDNNISGRVTNKSDFKLIDAAILLNDKVIYLGDIDKDMSISLSRSSVYNIPINNNYMVSNFMSYYPRSKIEEYYLNKSIYNYSDSCKLFAFVEKNNTIDILTKNINEVYGMTMVVKNIELINNNGNRYDLSTFSSNIVNHYGNYNLDNNSIIGNQEVVNEYYLDENYKYSKLYYNNISETNSNNENYNVPFYGNLSILNYQTNTYDDFNNNYINDISPYLSPFNTFTIKFNPAGKDVLSRNISIPQFRVIGEFND